MSSLRGRRPVVGAYSERIRRGRYAPAATFVVALLAAGGLLTLVPTGAVPVASGVVTPSAAIRLANVAPVHSALLVPASAMFVGNVNVGKLGPYPAHGVVVSNPPAAVLAARARAPVPLGPRPAASAPVVALSMAASNSSGPIQLVSVAEGINSNQCGCAPPDVQVAAGPSSEVEMVNLEGAIFNATGVEEKSFSLSTFFSSGSDFLSDPKVIYDAPSGRWFASMLDVSSTPTGYTRLAVSSSSDPNGTWHVYTIAMPSGTFGDQPILGVSSSDVAVSGDIFSLSGSSFYGSAFWVVNKTEAMSGATNLSVQQFGPDSSTYELHPVQSVSTSPNLYVVMTYYYGVVSSYVSLYNVTGTPPATVSYTISNLTVGSITPGPSADQPGTGNLLDVGDSRVNTAVYHQGVLWLGFTDQCQLATDTTSRSCTRLVELNATTPRVVEDFDISRNGTFLYYPSLSVAPDGTLSLLVGASSTTLDPSLLLTGRLAMDPPGSVLPAIWLIQGSSNQACGYSPCRYGDYFGNGVIPNSTVFWVAGEYGGTVTTWQTHLGAARYSGPLSVALGVTPASLEVGQSVVVTLTLQNSTCGVGTYCTVHLPLAVESYDRTCAALTSATTIAVNFTTAGDFTLGAGGWIAVYSAANCASPTLMTNLSIPSVPIHVDPALGLALVANPSGAADVGQAISFTAAVTGGAAPFSYLWSGLPAGCTGGAASIVSCAPTTSGPATPAVSVFDGYGVQANASLNYWIDPAITANISVSPVAIDLGGRVSLVAIASGGSGTYSYTWNGLPAACPSQDQPTLSCQPTGTGVFTVNVTVTDSNGGIASSSSVSVEVLPALGVTLHIAPTSLHTGDSIALTATISGGQGPFTFTWAGLPGGCLSSNVSAISCVPAQSGTFTVNVTVSDTAGGSTWAVGTVTVTTAATGIEVTTTYILIGAIVVVALAAVVAVVLLRRRRRR